MRILLAKLLALLTGAVILIMAALFALLQNG